MEMGCDHEQDEPVQLELWQVNTKEQGSGR